jgi:hypothetical protein
LKIALILQNTLKPGIELPVPGFCWGMIATDFQNPDKQKTLIFVCFFYRTKMGQQLV